MGGRGDLGVEERLLGVLAWWGSGRKGGGEVASEKGGRGGEGKGGRGVFRKLSWYILLVFPAMLLR